MANNMSYIRKTGVLNWLRGVTEPAPDTVFAALFTSNPGPAGDGSEVSGGGYARVAIPWTEVSIDPATHNASISNSAAITWPEATEEWGIVSHIAIMNAAHGGTTLYSTALTTPRDVHKDDNIAVKVGKIVVIQQ